MKLLGVSTVLFDFYDDGAAEEVQVFRPRSPCWNWLNWSLEGDGVAQKTRHGEAPRRDNHSMARVLPTHHGEAPRRGDHSVAHVLPA